MDFKYLISRVLGSNSVSRKVENHTFHEKFFEDQNKVHIISKAFGTSGIFLECQQSEYFKIRHLFSGVFYFLIVHIKTCKLGIQFF